MAFDYRAEYRRGFGGWQTLLGVLVRGVAGEDKPAGIGLKLTAATRFRLYALSPVFCARE